VRSGRNNPVLDRVRYRTFYPKTTPEILNSSHPIPLYSFFPFVSSTYENTIRGPYPPQSLVTYPISKLNFPLVNVLQPPPDLHPLSTSFLIRERDACIESAFFCLPIKFRFPSLRHPPLGLVHGLQCVI